MAANSRFEPLNSALPAALVSGLVLALAGPSAQAQNLTPFKFGISAPVVTIFPVWMADAGGFYAKEGLKVEVVSMEGGSRGVQVLLSGEIQGMHVGVAPVIQANRAGADIRAITSSANTIPITIFTKPEIKSAADLKGKSVGISAFGSETDIAISLALQKLGLDRKDVTILQIGGSSQRFAALTAGRIDAVPLLEPTITMAKEKGFNPILNLAAQNTPWIFDSVVVTRIYMQQNGETLTRFVRAYLAGAYLALSDEKKAKEEIAKRFKTQDPKVIDATYQDFKRLMPRDAAPSVEGAKNVMEQLQAVGIEVGSTDVKDHLDTGVIDGLKRSGYFAQLEKEFPVK
ncbi:MAG: ABC transporter substrate-binding protein [Xanthobacteraceae bacterium]